MYRSKAFRVRELSETLADVQMAARQFGPRVEKVFVADGDALILDMAHWEAILSACRASFPRLRQVSCYAMASNILAKTPEQLQTLREQGLTLFYIGPESGDETTMRRLAKQPRPPEPTDPATTSSTATSRQLRRPKQPASRPPPSSCWALAALSAAPSTPKAPPASPPPWTPTTSPP